MRPTRKVAADIVARMPRTSYAVAGAVDRVTSAVLPSPPVPAAALGPLATVIPDLGLAARSGWERSLRYRLLSSVYGTKGTPWPDSRLVTLPELSELPAPAVLATLHMGPMLALGLLLSRLRGPVVAFTAGLPDRDGVRTVDSSGTEWKRAQALHEAVLAVRNGGYVFLAVDAQGRARVDMPLLGRRFSVGAGAFAIARLGNAPVIPVLARWVDGRAEVHHGPAIEPADPSTMAASMGAWVDEYLRRFPADLGAGILRDLAAAPALEPPAAQPASSACVS